MKSLTVRGDEPQETSTEQDIGQKRPNHTSRKDDEEMERIHDNFSIIHEKRVRP
jgi:hypothetical protein